MFVGSIMAAVLLGLKMVNPHMDLMQQHGPMFVIASVLIVCGIQLLALGLLGELQVRHYYSSQRSTSYTVDRLVRLESADERTLLSESKDDNPLAAKGIPSLLFPCSNPPPGFILNPVMKAIQDPVDGRTRSLELADLPIPQPGAGQVLIRIEATGVNFIEIYFRKGVYKASFPMIPGSEAAGTVEELGPGVNGFKAGDAVASVSVIGSYAEYALVPAAQLVKIPEGLSMEHAAAAMLQGMTAHYLAFSTYPLKKGDTALVHAGAGGVGLLLTQIAARIGARVITTVSTKAKAELSREAGASDVILYTEQDFETEVKRLTGGKGVDVVYDSVGKTTFDKSLNCLHPRG
jgi:NADPH:quinone reductase